MNTTYLLIMFLVLLATIGGWVLAVRARDGSHWEAIGVLGGVASGLATLGMLMASFGGTCGTPPIVTDTAAFAVEKTPYRVIVKAFDRETTFTDAFTVANAARIKSVRLTVQRNAWGITHERVGSVVSPQVSLVFNEEAK